MLFVHTIWPVSSIIILNLFLLVPWVCYHLGLNVRKPVFGGLRITKVLTHLRMPAVWSAPFVTVFANLKLATSEILIFYLVSIIEQTGLGTTWLETPNTGFVMSRPIYDCGPSWSSLLMLFLTLKAPIMTAADDKILSKFLKKIRHDIT